MMQRGRQFAARKYDAGANDRRLCLATKAAPDDDASGLDRAGR